LLVKRLSNQNKKTKKSKKSAKDDTKVFIPVTDYKSIKQGGEN
jgi:hypothetical protein